MSAQCGGVRRQEVGKQWGQSTKGVCDKSAALESSPLVWHRTWSLSRVFKLGCGENEVRVLLFEVLGIVNGAEIES
jgi:hypothetical protein